MSKHIFHDPDAHLIRVSTDPYQLTIHCQTALQRFSINDFKKMIRVVLSQLDMIPESYAYLEAWTKEIAFLASHIRVNQPEYKAKHLIVRLAKFADYINKQLDKLPPKYFYD